jgi:hypothetical protein
MWPEIDLNVPVDFNGDGDPNGARSILNGSECLVFFLGGMPLALVPSPGGPNGSETPLGIARQTDSSLWFEDVTSRALQGFCRNPTLPFARSSDVDTSGNAIPARDERDAPLFEFDPGRLSDVDLDGFWEYYPPHVPVPAGGAFDPRVQPHPYVYLSSYDGQGYNLVIQPSGEVRITHDPAWGPLRSPLGLRWPLSRSPIELDPSAPTERLEASFPPSTIQWWNPRGFQIIAPGLDGMLGEGDLNTANPGVADFDPAKDLSTVTEEMLDNLTNFAGGELADIK